jgi:hypothetical protein
MGTKIITNWKTVQDFKVQFTLGETSQSQRDSQPSGAARQPTHGVRANSAR